MSWIVQGGSSNGEVSRVSLKWVHKNNLQGNLRDLIEMNRLWGERPILFSVDMVLVCWECVVKYACETVQQKGEVVERGGEERVPWGSWEHPLKVSLVGSSWSNIPFH